MRLITMSDFLMGRSSIEDLPTEYAHNAAQMVSVANGLLMEFGEFRKVNSGYRRPEDNTAANGAKHSAHMTCEALDLEDKDGRLKKFCNEEILDKFGLFMEHPDVTPSWLHIQIRETKSGNRVFRP